VTTWLLAIARNLVIDHLRTGARHPGAVPIDDVPASELPRTDEASDRAGLSPELETAFTDLEERERELIALRYGADLPGPQVAALAGLSLANVHQILSRALRKLRDRLDS
jgi:RNA polymerase sigma-70 factor (ECF subfamily)